MLFLSWPQDWTDRVSAVWARVGRSVAHVFVVSLALYMIAICGSAPASAQVAQKPAQTEISNTQRLNVTRSKLETMRKSLEGAVAGMNP